MSRTYDQVVTVPLSGAVSEAFGIRGADAVGIGFPVITSAQAFLQVSPSSGGPFLRTLRTDGSTTAALNVGPGSVAALIDRVPYTFARVELGVPQAAVRSLSVTTRF